MFYVWIELKYPDKLKLAALNFAYHLDLIMSRVPVKKSPHHRAQEYLRLILHLIYSPWCSLCSFIGFYLKLLHLAITNLDSCSFLETLNLGGPSVVITIVTTSIKMLFLEISCQCIIDKTCFPCSYLSDKITWRHENASVTTNIIGSLWRCSWETCNSL